MNILPQADNKKYIEDIHLAPSANLVCHWLGLSQALLIASFWLFYNQGDLAINMIKVILVKSLILKSIDLLPCSRASFGLISSVIGVILLKTGIQIDGLPRSSFSRYLCGCDGGRAAGGKCCLWILGSATDSSPPSLPPPSFSSLSLQAQPQAHQGS